MCTVALAPRWRLVSGQMVGALACFVLVGCNDPSPSPGATTAPTTSATTTSAPPPAASAPPSSPAPAEAPTTAAAPAPQPAAVEAPAAPAAHGHDSGLAARDAQVGSDLPTASAPLGGAPVIDARIGTPDLASTVDAESGLRLISARLEEGLTRAVVAWPPLSAESYAAWEIETAPAANGPFTKRAEGAPGGARPGTTAVVLSNPISWIRLVRVTKQKKRVVGSPIRALAVQTTDYDLGRRTVPYAPDHTARVRAMVRYPVALDKVGGHVPLAVITHGNAGVCRNAAGEDLCEMSMVLDDVCPEGMTPTPSAEGFIWLAESLAARGYVAVIIDANSVNCTHLPIVVQGRTSLILEHLRLWSRAVRGLESPLGQAFAGHIDLSRLALIGHSNGAEASALIPDALVTARLQPQLAGVHVSSVVAIAGSDSLWVTPEKTAFLVLQPSCDMQLPTYDGFRLFDRSVALRTAPHSAGFIVGGTHNGFNQRWHRDESMDEPSGKHYSACSETDKVAPWRQRALLDAAVGDWLLATVREGRKVVPAWLRGDAPMPPEIQAAVGGPIEISWSHMPAEKLVIESFDGEDAPKRNDLGGRNRVAGFSAGGRCYAIRCDDEFAHASWGGRFDWETTGARYLFELPPLDVRRWETLSFRMTQVPTAKASIAGRALDFTVRLIDGASEVASIPLSEAGGLPFPPMQAKSNENVRFFHGVLRTVRMHLAAFKKQNPKLDLEHIVAVELVMDRPGSDKGAVILSNVELTRP